MLEGKKNNDISYSHSFIVDNENAGQRLDIFLAVKLGNTSLSRSRVKSLLKSGHVLLNDCVTKPSARLKSGDRLVISIPEITALELTPQKIDFPVLYEDRDIIVISKPPGLVVHPGSGHQTATLVHGLLFHCNDLSGISGEERPGIVHRLDKDTTGVMVAAKHDDAHRTLVDQFKNRTVTKIYRAIVCGVPVEKKGRIEHPLGRHRVNRRKMAVSERGGRSAVTNWKLLEEFISGYSYIELKLETGRTHQIRVHMASAGHPVAGDELYGGKCGRALPDIIKRQCLHSYKLGFVHPVNGKEMDFTAELWPDMINLLSHLRNPDDNNN